MPHPSPEFVYILSVFPLGLLRVGSKATSPFDLRRGLFLSLGLLFVGIAILGAILPVLPTTPWVLLAGYCFARSSPRLHRWLRNTPYFGHLLRDWETHRGIRWRVKIFAVCMVVTVISLTAIFSGAPGWAKLSAAGLGSVGIGTILFVVPTVWDAKRDRPRS